MEFLKENNSLLLDPVIDEMNADVLEKNIDIMIGKGNDNIVLDLSNVKYISSLGIGKLMMAHKKALKNGKRINIHGLSDKAKEILDLVGILKLFEII